MISGGSKNDCGRRNVRPLCPRKWRGHPLVLEVRLVAEGVSPDTRRVRRSTGPSQILRAFSAPPYQSSAIQPAWPTPPPPFVRSACSRSPRTSLPTSPPVSPKDRKRDFRGKRGV